MNGIIMWSPGVTLEHIERQVIVKAYFHYRENKTATAAALGISVRTLDNKFEKYALDDQGAKEADEQRQRDKEHQLARSRGIVGGGFYANVPQVAQQPASSAEAATRNDIQPAQNAAAEQPVSVPQRTEVQSVLPKNAAHGGNSKRR